MDIQLGPHRSDVGRAERSAIISCARLIIERAMCPKVTLASAQMRGGAPCP